MAKMNIIVDTNEIKAAVNAIYEMSDSIGYGAQARASVREGEECIKKATNNHDRYFSTKIPGGEFSIQLAEFNKGVTEAAMHFEIDEKLINWICKTVVKGYKIVAPIIATLISLRAVLRNANGMFCEFSEMARKEFRKEFVPQEKFATFVFNASDIEAAGFMVVKKSYQTGEYVVVGVSTCEGSTPIDCETAQMILDANQRYAARVESKYNKIPHLTDESFVYDSEEEACQDFSGMRGIKADFDGMRGVKNWKPQEDRITDEGDNDDCDDEWL